MKLNFGCGKDIKKGYINIDYHKFEGVDKIINLNEYPLPFNTKSVSEIICQDIIEHLDNIPRFMLELKRICKKGAKIYIRVPHFTSRNVWGDLEHKRGFNWDSFNTNEYIINNFDVLSKKITFSKLKFFMNPIANKMPYMFENYLRIFSATNIEFILKVK